MKNIKLKEQKGFAASDALIAVIIIALFAGLIATISYNIYISNSSIKRMSMATSYIVDMFEYIDKTYYDDVTQENLVNYFNNKYYYQEDKSTKRNNAEVRMKLNNEEIETPFKAEIKIQKYNQTEGNTDKLDLVQEITMTVTYKLGNKDQKIEMKKIKSRENLKTPNVPDISLLKVEEGYHIYPLSNTNNTWKVCNPSDNSWYNYESGNWALAIKTNKELSINQQIDKEKLSENEAIYAWIPRYAYNSNTKDLKFLFSNSNNYISINDGYDKINPIESSYTIPSEFGQNTGIWTSNNSDTLYQDLNNVYPLNK